MDNIYKTTEYKGYSINIHYDSDASSPRDPDQFYNLGTIYTAHNRYQPEENFRRNFEEEDVFDGEFGVFTKSFLREYIALPLYLYDHSGITVNTTGFSCRWDTSRFGIIVVSLEKVKKEYGWKIITDKRRKKIESYLDGEVNTLNDYYTGSVYGYTIEDKDENEIDSCWGYYGDDCIEEMEKGCKSTIDWTLSKIREDKIKAKFEEIRKYGKQLFLPFNEFPEYISEPI